MIFNAWLETDEGREQLELLTCGPVSEYEATKRLESAWNAARSVEPRVVGIPAGWKLVPIEPTDAMIYAMTRATANYDERKDSYRAMLAAAPRSGEVATKCLAQGCTRKVRTGQWCWQHADMEHVQLREPDAVLNEQFPDARRFLSKGDGEADRETVVGPSSGFLDGWGKLCEGCKQPVNYPTNRYMDSMFCLGDRVWHSRCVPAGGAFGTFTISGNGGGGQQVETPASRERAAAPTTDSAPKMARPFWISIDDRLPEPEMKIDFDKIDPLHPLASLDGLNLFVALLAHTGSLCPKCGFGTRVTSKRWAKCKKCGERVERKPFPGDEPSGERSHG